MQLFAKKPNQKVGVIIDVGSGSVLAAIIVSDTQKNHPEIIWSKREHTPNHKKNGNNSELKSIATSLINVMMALESEGRKKLTSSDYGHKINEVQVNISAPWSYTITKTITYQKEEEFTLTEELVDELLRIAKNKLDEDLSEKEKVAELGLEIVARNTIQTIANGYNVIINNKQKATDLKIVEANSVVQEPLVKTITEIESKIFPYTQVKHYSFMLPFYYVIDELANATNYCLVDITYEATEIGIIRDGALTYCSHISIGVMTLAKDLAETLKIPTEEAFGYFKKDSIDDILETYSSTDQDKINKIFNDYQNKLTELFKETGDSLMIPKKLFLHSNLYTEEFFSEQIAKGAEQSTKSNHAIYKVSNELLTKNFPKDYVKKINGSEYDTSLLISAHFFHTRSSQSKFTQL